VPEVKNLDQPLAFIEPIVNPDRRMKHLADAGTARNQNAEPWEVPQQLDMIEKSRSEPAGGCDVIRADVVEKNLEVN
jgi:hypothetical protein